MDRSVIGEKTFDIDTDGLAHVGMLPDFIADLEAQGVTGELLDPLLNSASVRDIAHGNSVDTSG